MLPEQLLDRLDCRGRALNQRIAIARVSDGGLQHVAQFHGAVVPQQQHPGLKRAGNAGREQAGAGHHLQAFAAIMRDGRFRGRRALAADHLDLCALHVMHDDRHIAAGAVQMRLDHLQREGGGDAGVERIATLFQHGHPDRGGDPVRRGNDPERSFDFRPCGERIGIDVAQRAVSFSLAGFAAGLDHSLVKPARAARIGG